MTLGQKVRALRQVEGELRGLGREMSQHEVVRAIAKELDGSFSQSYLSQVESGARPHLTHGTRELLARFFRVHPGYLVTDPPGFHTELVSDLRTDEAPLDEWLRQGADRFAHDAELADALVKLAANDDSRRCLVLLGAIADTPALVDRLLAALKPVIA
jgi:transcriptional regulator with XRE-family HTH domain